MLPGAIKASEQVSKKKQLRRRVTGHRDSLGPELRALKSAAACALALPKLPRAGIVAVYSPMRSELDPSAIVAALRASGCTLAYPRMASGTRILQFAAISELGELVRGPFQVDEPPGSAPTIPLSAIDAFVVPGLSFDASGNRLGYGKGYYDHTLAQHPGAMRLGLCFQEQIATAIPREGTDQRMDWVVTDTQLFTGPARKRAADPKVPS